MSAITLGDLTLRAVEAHKHSQQLREQAGGTMTFEALGAENLGLRLQVEMYRMQAEKNDQELSMFKGQYQNMYEELSARKSECFRGREAIRLEKRAHDQTFRRLRIAERLLEYMRRPNPTRTAETEAAKNPEPAVKWESGWE